MEICRSANEVRVRIAEVDKRSYLADAIAIERPQFSLNLKAVAPTSKPGGFYKITYDVAPEGIGSFEPVCFGVARYDGAHYELTEEAGGRKSAQYNELPVAIRERIPAIGFFAPVASVQRDLAPSQQIAPDGPAPQAGIQTTPEANRAALIRRNAKQEIPTILAARRKGPALPDVRSVGKMEIPCDHCGALRWPVDATKKSTRLPSGSAENPDIRDAPEPTMSLLGGRTALPLISTATSTFIHL